MSDYVVIRCSDGEEVAQLDYFPASDRALMLRDGARIFFRDLLPDEIIGTPHYFHNLLVRAGYEPAN